MKKVLITFGSEGYERGMESLARSARAHFDEIRTYKTGDIDRGFWNENANLFAHKRGFGYWLWKPYFIRRTLLELSPGDIVFYSDALVNFTGSPAKAIEECRNNRGLLSGFQRYEEKICTKRDCFILMNADTEEYWNSYHINAAHQICERNDFAISVMDEWIKYCKNEDIVSDSSSKLGQDLPGNCFHRHDQSILSILYKKHKITMHKSFCQYGEAWLRDYGFMSHSKYGCFLNHHRYK